MRELVKNPIVLILLVVLLLIIIYNVFVFVSNSGNKNQYGKIPVPVTTYSGSTPNYIKINLPKNIEGQLPKNTEARVFALSAEDKNIVYQNLKPVIEKFGITGSPVETNVNAETYLLWNSSAIKLQVKTTTGQFVIAGIIKLDVSRDAPEKTLERILKELKIIDGKETKKILYLTTVGSDYVKTDNPKNASAMQVVYTPKIDNLELVGVGIMEGVVSAKVDLRKNAIIEIKNFMRKINTESFSIYKIRKALDVLDNLTPDKIKIISYKSDNNTDINNTSIIKNITVKNVALSYLLTPEAQLYLQPVYIISCSGQSIEGYNGNLIFYVPAIINP